MKAQHGYAEDWAALEEAEESVRRLTFMGKADDMGLRRLYHSMHSNLRWLTEWSNVYPTSFEDALASMAFRQTVGCADIEGSWFERQADVSQGETVESSWITTDLRLHFTQEDSLTSNRKCEGAGTLFDYAFSTLTQSIGPWPFRWYADGNIVTCIYTQRGVGTEYVYAQYRDSFMLEFIPPAIGETRDAREFRVFKHGGTQPMAPGTLEGKRQELRTNKFLPIEMLSPVPGTGQVRSRPVGEYDRVIKGPEVVPPASVEECNDFTGTWIQMQNAPVTTKSMFWFHAYVFEQFTENCEGVGTAIVAVGHPWEVVSTRRFEYYVKNNDTLMFYGHQIPMENDDFNHVPVDSTWVRGVLVSGLLQWLYPGPRNSVGNFNEFQYVHMRWSSEIKKDAASILAVVNDALEWSEFGINGEVHTDYKFEVKSYYNSFVPLDESAQWDGPTNQQRAFASYPVSPMHHGAHQPTKGPGYAYEFDPEDGNPPNDLFSNYADAEDVVDAWPIVSQNYTVYDRWRRLKCPAGTNSAPRSGLPDDCEQIGVKIAIINIYPIENPYVSLTKHWLTIYGNKKKKSFKYGDSLADYGFPKVPVDFCAFDPAQESTGWDVLIQQDGSQLIKFDTWDMEPMDLATLTFDFSRLGDEIKLNTNGAGHYDIAIHSNILDENGLSADASHELPPFFRRDANEKLNYMFRIGLFATRKLNIKVTVHLLHGTYITDINKFNQSLWVDVKKPSRAVWQEKKYFLAMLSRDATDGFFELPYNMAPGHAAYSGDEGIVLDAIDTAGRENAPDSSIQDTAQTGDTFWTVHKQDTYVMPWLPFFSNCEGFDSHIIIWDLMETNRTGNMNGKDEEGNYDGAGSNCDLKPSAEETFPVAPLTIDLSTFELRMEADADQCEIFTKCSLEENMKTDERALPIWMELLEHEQELYKMTANPVGMGRDTFESFQDFAAEEYFDTLLGQDDLVPVIIDLESHENGPDGEGAPREEGGKTNRFAKLVNFVLRYKQVDKFTKQIVEVALILGDWHDNEQDPSYTLRIEFSPLGWMDLMNLFKLPAYAYAALYAFKSQISPSVSVFINVPKK